MIISRLVGQDDSCCLCRNLSKSLTFYRVYQLICVVGKETVKYVSGDCTSVAILALNPEFELSKVAERGLELCIVLLTLSRALGTLKPNI